MSAVRSTGAGEIALAVLTMTIFVAATASIVIMLGLLPASDIAQLQVITDPTPFSGQTPSPQPVPLTEEAP